MHKALFFSLPLLPPPSFLLHDFLSLPCVLCHVTVTVSLTQQNSKKKEIGRHETPPLSRLIFVAHFFFVCLFNYSSSCDASLGLTCSLSLIVVEEVCTERASATTCFYSSVRLSLCWEAAVTDFICCTGIPVFFIIYYFTLCLCAYHSSLCFRHLHPSLFVVVVVSFVFDGVASSPACVACSSV
jgi:hypothetical protein